MTDPTSGSFEPGTETPEHKADRVAEARRKRRANQTTRNLIGSLVASLGIVLFLVLVVVRPDPVPLEIDHLAAAAQAEASLGTDVVAPIVPPTWQANRAELAGSRGVDEWTIGFITADRLRAIAEPLRRSGYGEYLLKLLDQPVLG